MAPVFRHSFAVCRYGKGPSNFASEYGCPFAEAREHIAKFKATFKGVFRYKMLVERQCEKHEGVYSLTGRKRDFNSKVGCI